MKVILAGISKTGTKSVANALTELGMNVHDTLEHYTLLHDDWMKIATKGGTTEVFRRMYESVDAVTDTPVWYYWEQLSEAFPEAKIILTIRESEEELICSTKRQAESLMTPFMRVMLILSPTYRRFINFLTVLGIASYKQPHSLNGFNELLFKKVYRKHYSYVKRTVPKSKLLVYSVKEGWEPLCNFLEVETPSTPFPHKNKLAALTKELMKTHPLFIRADHQNEDHLILVPTLIYKDKEC